MDLAQAIVNGALAITRVLAVSATDPFGINQAIQVALTAATTAAQIAVISSQEFAQGGLIQGGENTSHANGGVKNRSTWERGNGFETGRRRSDNKKISN